MPVEGGLLGELADEEGGVLVAAVDDVLEGAPVADLDGVLEEDGGQLVGQAGVPRPLDLLDRRRAEGVNVEELVVERGGLAHLAEDGAVRV